MNGYDWANNDGNLTDDQGHGTNVAGILAATGNNSNGVAGVNWNCKIMVGKVLNSSNSGFYSWWISGINYAVVKGAKVINMSLGGTSLSLALQDACDFAMANNSIIVACMHNQNSSTVNYPTDFASTIAVGSTSCNDRRTVPFVWSATSGSNYVTHIDLVAPGSYVLGPTHTNNTGYTYWSGTSQATPLVAGTVSLMLALNNTMTFNNVRTTLMASAQDQTGNPAEDVPGFDNYYGAGRLNAYAALFRTLPLQMLSFSAQKRSNAIALEWRVSDEINTSHFEVENSNNGQRFTAIANVPARNTSGTNSYVHTHSHPAYKLNYYRIEQIDKDGKYVYSRTIAVALDKKINDLTIASNPVSGMLNVLLPSFTTEEVLLNLFDISGRMVMNKR